MTGVSYGIQSQTPASQSLGRESPRTLGDFWEDPYTQGETTRDMTLSLSPVAPSPSVPLASKTPAYQSPPHSKPGFPSM